MTSHTVFGGKVHVYKRGTGRFWQCATFLNSKNHRATTKEESLTLAKEFAEDWYLTLKDKNRRGELVAGKTFMKAARKFEEEYEAITQGHRSPKWVQGHKDRIRLHLMPYFGRKSVK